MTSPRSGVEISMDVGCQRRKMCFIVVVTYLWDALGRRPRTPRRRNERDARRKLNPPPGSDR